METTVFLMCLCYPCTYVLCATCVPSDCRVQKRVSYSLEMELEMCVSCQIGAGKRTQDLKKPSFFLESFVISCWSNDRWILDHVFSIRVKITWQSCHTEVALSHCYHLISRAIQILSIVSAISFNNKRI